jgi:hypothetical protein
MARKQKIAKRPKPKTVLRLPDLEQSKNAVLNSLAAASSQESYGHAECADLSFECLRSTGKDQWAVHVPPGIPVPGPEHRFQSPFLTVGGA